MRRLFNLVAIVAALTVGGAASAKLKIVATHADLASITSTVGGDRVEVVSIVEPTQDPHFVDARPHLMLELNQANLVVLVGLQLEVGWLPNLLTGARNSKILPGTEGYLDTSTLIERRQVPKGAIDRSMGDLHPGGNPHFSKSPAAGLRIADGIARRLSQLDPDGAGTYRRNLSLFQRQLGEAMARWEKQMQPYRGTKVIAYHESWVYFTDWLGLDAVAFVEPKPGIPPDPAHIAKLLGQIRTDKVRVILQEEYYPDSTSRLLADKSGARLILSHGGAHISDGEDYIGYLDRQVQSIVQVLGKGMTP
ncbi:MAG: metal ABC transporter substrate-binding protein [Pseudomonadota bacterium]